MVVTDADLADMLSVDETAEKLRVSRMTIYRRIKAGELDSVKIGGKRWITQRQYLDFVNREARRAS